MGNNEPQSARVLTPEKYLAEQGIEIDKTVLISFVDNIIRNPNLLSIMEDYANRKVMEDISDLPE